MAARIIHVSRHPLTDDRLAALKAAFGDSVEVVNDDFRFGDDPIAALQGAIERVGGEVVAVVSNAPLPILARWLGARREFSGVQFLQPEFHRENGRAKVTGQDENGRDILAFSHWLVVKEVRLVTEPLQPPPAP